MSSPTNPVVTATDHIQRANRLISLRAHPGFLDLLQISRDLVAVAVENCSGYPGWDPQQMMVLKIRQQSATEHHEMLIAKVLEAIRIGIDAAAAQPAVTTTAAEAVDQGDYVRQAVLTKFKEKDDENRIPGSY